jgi:hypothetical protein
MLVRFNVIERQRSVFSHECMTGYRSPSVLYNSTRGRTVECKMPSLVGETSGRIGLGGSP